MILADIHCHLDFFESGVDGIVERARKAGVRSIINNGVSPEKNRIVLGYAKKYDIVKAALGLYPTDAVKLGDEEVDNELKFIEKNKDKIIALGEIGLDNVAKDINLLNKQKEILEKFFVLSEKIKKPMILHSRKAENDIVEMLESSNVKKCVLHCFNGNFNLIKKAADLGYYFSIPTNVVRMQHFQKMAEEVNINQLLTETDAPFLSPYKEKKNEPAFVIESVKKIAEIKGFTAEEVANNVWMNCQGLFF